jgi:hypothetical protein
VRKLLQATKVCCGSWLRDNALTQSVTVYDPVNVVRHGPFEQFFLLDDQSHSGGMLGKGLLAIGT